MSLGAERETFRSSREEEKEEEEVEEIPMIFPTTPRPFRWSHARMCEERVRRKVLASSCASREDDTQTKVGREVKEKMKTVKRSGGCDVRSIEEIKAEIALVERQLREKRREEEE